MGYAKARNLKGQQPINQKVPADKTTAQNGRHSRIVRIVVYTALALLVTRAVIKNFNLKGLTSSSANIDKISCFCGYTFGEFMPKQTALKKFDAPAFNYFETALYHRSSKGRVMEVALQSDCSCSSPDYLKDASKRLVEALESKYDIKFKKTKDEWWMWVFEPEEQGKDIEMKIMVGLDPKPQTFFLVGRQEQKDRKRGRGRNQGLTV